jgi:hypothetical protein
MGRQDKCTPTYWQCSMSMQSPGPMESPISPALITSNDTFVGGLHELRLQSPAADDPEVPLLPEPHRPRPNRAGVPPPNVLTGPLCRRCVLQRVARLPVGIKQLAGVPVHVVVFVCVINLAKRLLCFDECQSLHRPDSPRRASECGLPLAITRSR